MERSSPAGSSLIFEEDDRSLAQSHRACDRPPAGRGVVARSLQLNARALAAPTRPPGTPLCARRKLGGPEPRTASSPRHRDQVDPPVHLIHLLQPSSGHILPQRRRRFLFRFITQCLRRGGSLRRVQRVHEGGRAIVRLNTKGRVGREEGLCCWPGSPFHSRKEPEPGTRCCGPRAELVPR